MKVYPSPGFGDKITSSDEYTFTSGQCHRLAEVLSEVTGWPMYAFFDTFWEPGEYDIHAFVKTPKRTFLDVEGVHTATELKVRWSEKTIRLVDDPFELNDWAPYMDAEGIPRAWEIAPLVLGLYYKRVPTRILEKINEHQRGNNH